MKRLRWPGLAIRSMVWTVASGRTMLMRLLIGIKAKDLMSKAYTQLVCMSRGINRLRGTAPDCETNNGELSLERLPWSVANEGTAWKRGYARTITAPVM